MLGLLSLVWTRNAVVLPNINQSLIPVVTTVSFSNLTKPFLVGESATPYGVRDGSELSRGLRHPGYFLRPSGSGKKSLQKQILPLIPLPMKVEDFHTSPFQFNNRTVIFTDKKMFAVSELSSILPALKLKVKTGQSVKGVIFKHDPTLATEGYKLLVDNAHVLVKYNKPVGALYAIESLKQLRMGNTNSFAPVQIEDAPRFKWRGMHLDVSRHFFPAKVIKRTLDLMAAVKMNVFHWHLVDDGGWRIEIKKYPKLTQMGAFRKGSGVPWDQNTLVLQDPKQGGETYGGFYTQEEIKDVVSYAADRGITVVPEIEMPGHTLPVLECYPELACKNATGYPGALWKTDVYCAGKEESFKFIEGVLDEVIALFPSKYIHIGGDEVDKKWWNACEDCQKRMKDENLKDAGELQSYFVKRVEKYINSKGRSMMGWDEILEGGLAPNAAVMSWRGNAGGIAAAKSNHTVVMSPTSHCYFDFGYDSTSTEHVYSWEPVPGELVGKERDFVIGGQCNVWTEWIPTVARYDRMVWPRAFAMAEVLWSSQPKNWSGFQDRLVPNLRLLEKEKVAYYLEEPAIPYAFAFDTQPMILSKSDYRMPIYTNADPKAPAKDWAMLLSQKLPIDKTFYAAYKRADGSLGDIAELYQSSKVISVPATMPAHGLEVSIWNGLFAKVSDFAAKPAESKSIAEAISLAPRPAGAGPFALRFRGRVKFPDEKFKLYLSSDDGSQLKLNGVTVINNDGPHSDSTKVSGIRAIDGFYDLEVLFFDAGGASALRVEYESATVKRRPLPASWLYEPAS
jgi:hexosaminidase